MHRRTTRLPYFLTFTMISQQQKHHAARRLDALLKYHASSHRILRTQYWQLIQVIRDKTSLLSPRAEAASNNPFSARLIILACARMARRMHKWHRTPETWDAPEASPYVQMRSLVQHLFEQYPVPDFMASIWWKEPNFQWGAELYLHLAKGQSLRRFSILGNFKVTKRIAALFMQAPDDMLPQEALRWSQVRALGGDERLARILIRKTCLSRINRDETFWQTVIRFLINNAPISAEETVEIVQFIHQQRYEPADTVWGVGAGDEPVQPDFSLRGRTLMSLRRHMAHWRSELIEKGYTPPPYVNPLDLPWEQSKIGSFCFEENEIIWSIEQLLTPRQLHNEGQIMNHCVASYVSKCARHKTTIWSMKIQKEKRIKHTLTIEVLPKTKVIFQAKGKRNCQPSDVDRDILERWAAQEGLKFSETA